MVQNPSSDKDPKTTVQGQETGYEAQASGLQGGYSALIPQGKTPPLPTVLQGCTRANRKRDQEKESRLGVNMTW